MSRPLSLRAGMPPWLPRALPFLCYALFLVAGSRVAELLLPDPRWLYAIQIAGVACLLVWHARDYIELTYPPASTKAEWLLSSVVGIVVFVLWINLDWPWLTLGATQGFDPRAASGAIDWPLAAVRLFGAAVVVPVMEELFWRSLVMRWIDNGPAFLVTDPRRISLRALLLSSLVFGFEHTLWFAGILAGFAYAWLYCRRGNLWSPVIAHAVTNLLLGVWVLTTGSWHFW